jgi:hypothetical protein
VRQLGINHRDLFTLRELTGVKSRLEGGQAVVLQHVKESSLSGIVKTEEKDLGILVEQA